MSGARIVNADPIYQGDQVESVVQVYDQLNQAVTIATGSSIDYGIFMDDNSVAYLVQKTIGDGITVRTQIGADIGKFDLVILPADTEPLAGVLYHECVMTQDGKPRTIFYGEFPVNVSPIK